MMKMRKTRVSMALGAVLAAGALAPATSFGWSVDTENGNLRADSAGDTLLFPVYTTAQNATSSFSVTNTSTTQTVLAKIRFREQTQSMDVLDFYAILSPNDKFDFWVGRPQAQTRPVMGWDDNTCVVGPAGSPVAFPEASPFVAFGSDDPDTDMQLGHLEVLGVANLENVCWDGSTSGDAAVANFYTAASCNSGDIDISALALHDSNGEPANCDALVNAFASQAIVTEMNIDMGQASDLDVDNVLVGRYLITGAGVGIEGGGDAIAIRDSDLGPGGAFSVDNRITAQSASRCDQDTDGNYGADENCDTLYAWDSLEWDHPHLGEMNNLAGFQDALYALGVTGDWSNNPDNEVGVDWVLSFPSKYAYLDWVSDCPDSPVSSNVWCLLDQTRTTYGNPQAWTQTSTVNLCLSDNDLSVFDTEEGRAEGNVNVSPGNRTTLDICQEMQVFTLGAEGDTPRESVIQYSDRRPVVEFLNLPARRGWAELGLAWPAAAPGSTVTGAGAVSGIIFTTRATEDPTINNGSITELQKFQ
jgi:hypothetical protein